VVDDDTDLLNQLTRTLVSNGLGEVESLSSPLAVMERVAAGDIQVILLDLVMPGMSGADLLRMVNQSYPQIPVIMMTAVTDVSTAVACIKSGAFDYLTKPLDTPRLYATVRKAMSFSEMAAQNRHLKDFLLGEPLSRPEMFSSILTADSKMKSIFKLVETVAATPHHILITGETGVGKELIARAIHDASGLTGEFVPVNVAGLDDVMFADMIFGHKRGAYTGASEHREGLISKASGGTLFLDEIGDMNQESQKMLLRLLQEKEYYRLGSDILHHSNARIIAASNRDFKKMIADGTFRQDLYHRLTIHQIKIPPLRERSGDIPLLAEHFARETAADLGKEPPELSVEIKLALSRYDFPGNVRELVNMIRNAVACSRGGLLTFADFQELAPVEPISKKGVVKVSTEGSFTIYASFEKFPTIDEVEELLIREAMRVSEGNKGVATELLGISRPTLNKKLESSLAAES
jgi:DNA-binding NtrC family response regulator